MASRKCRVGREGEVTGRLTCWLSSTNAYATRGARRRGHAGLKYGCYVYTAVTFISLGLLLHKKEFFISPRWPQSTLKYDVTQT